MFIATSMVCKCSVAPSPTCCPSDKPRRAPSTGGVKAKISDYEVLQELATICAMCNDSSIDYNEFKHCFEKVGEATETALVVLAEKINPYGLSKTGMSRREAAIVVKHDMDTKWKKVRGSEREGGRERDVREEKERRAWDE